MQRTKILIVDDEPDILEFLGYNLEKEGYQVITAQDGYEGIKKARIELPDLIILDLMMPGMDGIETCQILREDSLFSNTIIIFLTARNEDYSQVAGFGAGADDYVVKPIKLKVFLARIKAMIKRSLIPVITETKIMASEIMLNIDERMVYKKNQPLHFPKKEFELLSILIAKPKKLFTRDEIYQKIWGDEVIVSERTLDVYIRKIREKIGEGHIKTVKGVGYKYEP